MATSLETWQSITQDERLVRFFAGLFDRLGIVVNGTGEAFTCCHAGDRVEFDDHLDPARVDYSVRVDASQIARLAEEARGGEFDEAEAFRITRVLFTPATAAMLSRNRVLSNPLVRRLAGAESLIHVRLRPPEGSGETEEAHTLIHAARQWLVFPGLHGKARRTFILSTDDALDYQRHVFVAVKANTFGEWLRFGRWYRQWRKTVSRKGTARPETATGR